MSLGLKSLSSIQTLMYDHTWSYFFHSLNSIAGDYVKSHGSWRIQASIQGLNPAAYYTSLQSMAMAAMLLTKMTMANFTSLLPPFIEGSSAAH